MSKYRFKRYKGWTWLNKGVKDPWRQLRPSNPQRPWNYDLLAQTMPAVRSGGEKAPPWLTLAMTHPPFPRILCKLPKHRESTSDKLRKEWFRRHPAYDPSFSGMDKADAAYWKHPCNRFVARQHELMQKRAMKTEDAYQQTREEFERDEAFSRLEKHIFVEQAKGVGVTDQETVRRYIDSFSSNYVAESKKRQHRKQQGELIKLVKDMIDGRKFLGDSTPVHPENLPKGLTIASLVQYLDENRHVHHYFDMERILLYDTATSSKYVDAVIGNGEPHKIALGYSDSTDTRSPDV